MLSPCHSQYIAEEVQSSAQIQSRDISFPDLLFIFKFYYITVAPSLVCQSSVLDPAAAVVTNSLQISSSTGGCGIHRFPVTITRTAAIECKQPSSSPFKHIIRAMVDKILFQRYSIGYCNSLHLWSIISLLQVYIVFVLWSCLAFSYTAKVNSLNVSLLPCIPGN